MKVLLGRIICEEGTFVEEFIGRDPLSPRGFSWARDKAAAHDFKSAMVADHCRLGNAYTAADGRLRFPMVICDVAEPVRVFPPRRARFSAKVRSMRERLEAMETRHPHEVVFAETARRCGEFEPPRSQEAKGGNDYE